MQVIGAGLVLTLAIFLTCNSPIRPVSFRLPPPPKLTGALTPKHSSPLSQANPQESNSGTESIAIDEHGVLYTGLANGRIVSITGKTIKEIGYTGDISCSNEEECGRPLGIRFHNGSLYVINAYKGILKVEKDGSSQELVVNMKDEAIRLNNIKTRFINDLDITRSGIIYFTDSSSQHSRQYNAYEFLESGPHGTLFSFDLTTREIKVLIAGLHFPNGVQLAPDESFVLVAECSRARIVRYYLKGDMAGQWDYFAMNLPGFPDNIRPRESGGYWVGMAAIRRQPFSLIDALSSYPQVRSIMTKIIPHFLLKSFVSKYGIIVALDEIGNVMDSLQDPGGHTIPSASEVSEYEGTLYIGSYYSKFIGKLKLRDEY